MNKQYDQEAAIKRLETAVRARVPIIGIQTTEEDRITERIKLMMSVPMLNVAGDREVAPPRLVFRWTYTRGLRIEEPIDNGLPGSKITAAYERAKDFCEDRDTEEPADAIAVYLAWARADDSKKQMEERASVMLMCDLHRFLMPGEAGGAGSIETMRALRDLFAGLLSTKSNAILIAPSMASLGDSDTEIVVIDFPLPTTEELTFLVKGAARKVSLPVDEGINNGGSEILAQALSGVTWSQASYILRQAMVEAHELSVDGCLPHIADMKAQTLKRCQGIELVQPVPIEHIGGLDLLKKAVANYPMLMSRAAKELAIRPPQGILLAGPPGTGKSWTCQVVGGGRLPTMRWSPAQSKSMYVGKSIENATSVLKAADAINKVVLWIDEVDLVFGGNTDGKHEVSQEMLQLMLTWLESRTSDVIVVMTTNHPERLPEAFRDRCDERWFVDLPRSVEEAEEVFVIHLGINMVTNLASNQVRGLAQMSVDGDLNPRNIVQGIKAAKRAAFFHSRDVTFDDLAAEFKRRIEMSAKSADSIRQMRKEALSWASPASSAQRVRKTAEAYDSIDA